MDDAGNFTGYMHLKDVMAIPQEAFERPITENKVRTLANLRLDDGIEDALTVMQRTGSHVARVLGPDSQTRGVLFLEDIIEQLIGEIRDATQAQGFRRSGESFSG